MSQATLEPAPATQAAPVAPPTADDLRDIIEQYNTVTERLQHSHEALQAEVQRLQHELASTNAQLQRSKRLSALGEMAAGIAHEIRNPLAAIRLYAEMVDADLALEMTPQGGAPAFARRPLGVASDNNRKIAEAVRGLSGIVDDVLSFARHIEPQARTVEPATLVRGVLDLHRPVLHAAGVEARVFCDVTELTADPELLKQALTNLVRNAAEAMHGTDDPRVLRVAVSQHAGVARITVADTGPGIDPDEVDRIFNPFFTTRSTGTGLGLAIVHRIVDAHGGAITVDHTPEGGAVFTLTLPHSIAPHASEAA